MPTPAPATSMATAPQSTVAGAPTLGGVEAALIAGLTATGVPNELAVPAVLVYRVATFWLPVLPGWLVFTLPTRRDVI
jgi:glycosyltransferase 2 family protein